MTRAVVGRGLVPRRPLLLLAVLAIAVLAAGAAIGQAADPPIVFVHGNGDTAALWHTTTWRFESSGYARDRLVAIDLRFPRARSVDARPQEGRTWPRADGHISIAEFHY